jgi:hypothetical protein
MTRPVCIKTQARMDALVEGERVHTFTVWRQGAPGVEARQLGVANSLEEAERGALVHLQHKDTLCIHEWHGGRRTGVLHAYRVRKGAAKYVRNPVSGLSERVDPMTLDKLFALPVNSFAPTPPFDAFLDDPVGIDRTIVEQRA